MARFDQLLADRLERPHLRINRVALRRANCQLKVDVRTKKRVRVKNHFSNCNPADQHSNYLSAPTRQEMPFRCGNVRWWSEGRKSRTVWDAERSCRFRTWSRCRFAQHRIKGAGASLVIVKVDARGRPYDLGLFRGILTGVVITAWGNAAIWLALLFAS